jgi:Sporulation and spore germination
MRGRALTALVAALLLLVAGEAPSALTEPAGSARIVRVRIFAPRGSPGSACARVFPLSRSVTAPAVLTGSLRALLRGPTAAERRRGYGGWFSAKTAGMLRGVRVTNGLAYVDFRNFSRVIPNASSSCGSAMLLAQLDRTSTQFPTVRRAIYSFEGSILAFYEWLQRSPPAS